MSLERIEEAGKLEPEWRRLEAAAQPSFFISWAWVGTLLHLLPPDLRPRLLRLAAGDRTIGLALLGRRSTWRHSLIRSHGLHLNATGSADYDCPFIEHNGLLVAPPWREACWDALLDWFRCGQSVGDELVLPGLSSRLAEPLIEDRRLRRHEIPYAAYQVDLHRMQATAGKFAPLLSTNARSQLHRAIRACGGTNALQLEQADSAAQALAWFGELKALHVAWWSRRGEPHAFARPFFETFHRALITRAFAEGGIEMLRITAAGAALGVLYNFRTGANVYAYQSGFADRHRRWRPGAISHALAIEHAFRTGAAIYDFMAGTNRLKQSFSTDRSTMYWTSVQLPRTKYRLERLARRAKALTTPARWASR